MVVISGLDNLPGDGPRVHGIDQDPVDYAVGLPGDTIVSELCGGGMREDHALVEVGPVPLQVERQREGDQQIDESRGPETTADCGLAIRVSNGHRMHLDARRNVRGRL